MRMRRNREKPHGTSDDDTLSQAHVASGDTFD